MTKVMKEFEHSLSDFTCVNQGKMSHSRNTRIDLLKVFSSFLVVSHHAFAYAKDLGILSGSAVDVSCILMHCVNVSLFVLIAGFLCHPQPIGIFYKNKAKKLLVPFATFSILKLVYSIFISNEFAHGSSISAQLVDAVFIGRQYWFIYAMCIIFFIAPIFWKTNKENINLFVYMAVGVIVLSVYDMMNWRFIPDVFQLSNALHYLPYFAIGYLIRNYRNGSFLDFLNKKRNNCIILILSFCSAAAFVVLYVFKNQTYYQYPVRFFLALFLAFMLWDITKLIENKQWIRKWSAVISRYSLQIMFFDAFFKVILFKLFGHFLPLGWGSIFVIIIMDILLSLLSCVVISRFKYMSFAFGVEWQNKQK